MVLVYILAVIGIIILDQTAKNIVIQNIKLNAKIEVIKNKFFITNVRNTGAAYGLLKNKPKFLLIFNSSLVFILILYFIRILKLKNENLLKISLSFIIGGALGNIIDRIKKGFVTDFLYIKIRNAPIFNFADLFIFISPIILLFKLIKK